MSIQWEVVKVGGSSVAEAQHWPTITDICRKKISQGKNVVLVLSALKNVSNALETLLQQSIAGVHDAALQRIKKFHYSFASQLEVDAKEIFDPVFIELFECCQQIHQQQLITPLAHAKLLSYGEILSTILGKAYLERYIDNCAWLDVRKILKTKNDKKSKTIDEWHHYLSAECNYEHDSEIATDSLSKYQLLVTQGFIASDQQGDTVLLGREGSDTTASYLAAIFGSRSIEIWTDVAGFYTTNPRELAVARQIKKLSYTEARRMASFGAKVLHPGAIHPAEMNNITIKVNDISQHLSPGTLIEAGNGNSIESVFAVVSRRNITSMELITPNPELIRFMGSLGYDILLQVPISEKESSKQRILLRFINTSRTEPDQKQLFDMLQQHRISQPHTVEYDLGMLTLIGSENQNWFQPVSNFLTEVYEIEQKYILEFQGSGRLSVMVSKTQLHNMLISLHSHFIELNTNSDFFGDSWNSLG